ncbi:MAG: hypothetical protein SH857_13870 [Chitinophagales bacterium]|nr:hypothetical protein [Chitinophagales bacterium]
MKKYLITAIISAYSFLAFAQNMGIDQPSPTEKLDVNGWIQLGNQSSGSTGTTGAIRYNTIGSLEFFDGTNWVAVGLPSVKFTNWGRPDCPATSSLVYTGTVGGSSHDQSGSGFNTLCLSRTPNFVDFNDANHNGALIYGLEYEIGGYGVSNLGGVAASSFQDREAECAVCIATATTMLMVPGTVVCPSGWTQQYWGYLMSVHYSQWSTEFVCVHNSATLYGSTSNSNGDLWYPVEAEICALRAPYIANRELTCSVCTK